MYEIQMELERELCSELHLTKCHGTFSWFKIHMGSYIDKRLLECYKHLLKYL